MGLYVKKNTSTWVTAKSVYVKSGLTTWKLVKKIFVKGVNGWAQFWPSAGPSPDFEVDLSTNKTAYPASGTSYPILTGTTWHWSTKSSLSLSYAFQSSASANGPWTNISTGSTIANPSSGNTTSVTYTPSFTDYVAGTTHFNFVVTASDGVNTRASNSYTQYDVNITLPAPIWTTTVPRIGGTYATGKTITWNVGKATISGSSSSVGYYTTIWKMSPTNVITYLYGTSSTPDFQSSDDYQYSIVVPTNDSGYTYYFTTYAAQALLTGATSSTSYSDNKTIINSPQIVTNPSITKYDGYQTTGYRLQGNTGTWNQAMTDYFWQWGYCSTNSTNSNDYFLMYNYSYNPITGSSWTPYNGTDTSENQNHTLTIPQYTYAYGNSTPISLAGKYINFYSNADIVNGGVYQYANQPPVQSVGPIYNAPGTPTSLNVYKGNSYNSSYSYVNFYWTDPANIGGTTSWYKYTVQYNNGGIWTNLGTTYSSTYSGGFASPLSLLVPTGTWDFRIKNENQDGLAAYSSTVNFQVVSGYTFSFGNVLYPNTNGQIGLDSGSSPVTVPSSGRVLAIYGLDLSQQTTGYWSDGRYFIIQFSGWQYQNVGVATYALRYQVRFDTLNPNYVDVLICNKGSSLAQPSYIGIYSNGTLYAGVQGPYVLSTNSSYRIYFDGTTGFTGGSSNFTQIPSADFVTTSLTAGTADDGYTSITTSANQYTPSYFSSVSGSVSSNTLSVSFTGNIDYSYYYYRLDTGSYYGTNFANVTGGTANPLTVSSLTSGTRYYLTLIPYNSLGQAGTTYQNYYDVPNSPSAFTTISGTKAFPTGATQSPSEPTQSRTLSTSWNSSTNSTYYEVQYEGSNDNSTWIVLQSLAGAPYLTTTSNTYTATYYRYYRYSVRARDAAKTLGTAAYSDYGSSGSLQYYYITGTNPGTPSITSVVPGTGTSYGSATVNYNFPSSYGSNTIDWNYWSLDNATWNQIYSTSFTISNLSASTGYYVYMRSMNYDFLYSSSTYQYFTTNAAPVYYTVTWNANGGSVSPSSSTQSTVGGSITAPTPTQSGYSFNGWYNASSGGSLIVNGGGSYTPSSNITLYARWTYVPLTPNITSITGQGAAANPYMTFKVYCTNADTINFTVTRTGTNAGSSTGSTAVVGGVATVVSGSNSTAYSISATPVSTAAGAGTPRNSRSINRTTTTVTSLYP